MSNWSCPSVATSDLRLGISTHLDDSFRLLLGLSGGCCFCA